MNRFLTYLATLFGRLPISWLDFLSFGLAVLWFDVLRIRRKQVVAQLLATNIAPNRKEAVTIGRRSVRHVCRVFFDTLVLSGLTKQEILAPIDIGRREIVDEILKNGKGVIVLTAHLGYFDRLAVSQSAEGYPLVIITKRLKPAWLHRFWMASRRRFGLEILETGGTFESLAAALEEGKALGLVADQHAPHGKRTTFFGLPCRSVSGIAELSLRTQAPIVPMALVRENGRLHMVVENPLPPAKRQEDVPELVQSCQHSIQNLIRRYPEQWLWLHRRWKG